MNKLLPNKLRSYKLQATSSNRGFVALLTVMIVGVVGISVGTSLILLGIGHSRTSLAIEQSSQARALANACVEEALQIIDDSTPFTGTGTLTMGGGTCEYTVTSQGGQNRTIATSGTVGTILRKVTVVIDTINPSINTTSWQEIP